MSSALEFLIRARDAGGSRAIDQFASHSEQASTRVGASWKKVGGLLAGAFAVDKVKDFLGDSIAEATESQKVGAQTAAVLKSTRGAANLTSTAIGNLATQISNKVGIDDEAIQSGENLLLTFTNIKNEAGAGNDIFSQTTKIMTDMSVATGTDMKASAIQLGKALNDPIKGVSALTKVGVSFTAQQKAQIAALVKTGDTMGAQKIILGELNKEFGGSAAAQVTPAEKAEVAWGNLKEQIGTGLLPVIGKFSNFATNTLIPALSATVGWVQQNESWLKPLAIAVGAVWAAWKLHTLATDAMAAVNTKMATLRTQFGMTATTSGTSSATVAEAEARQTTAIAEGSAEQVAAIRRVQLAQEQAAVTATETSAVQSRAAAGAASGSLGAAGAAGVAGRGVGRAGGVGGGALLTAGLVAAIEAKIGYDAGGETAKKAGASGKTAETIKLVGAAFGPVTWAANKASTAIEHVLGMGPSKSMRDLIAVGKNGATTVDLFRQALVADSGAAGVNTQAVASAALSHTSLAKEAAKAGLTSKDLTNAVTGNSAAYDKVVAAWKAGANPSRESLAALEALHGQFGLGTDAAKKFADQQGVALRSEQRTGTVTDLLRGKLGNFNQMNLTAAASGKVFNSGLQNVTRSVAANGATLDSNTSFGRKNIASIRAAAAEALGHAQAVYQQTGSLKAADKALATDRGQLIQTATRAGLTKTQVQHLADSITSIPANKKSKITVDTAAAYRAVTGFGVWYDGYLAKLAGKTIPVPKSPGGVSVSGGHLNPGIIGAPGGHAQGTGYWRGGRTIVGELGPEVLDLPAGSAITPNTAATSQGAFGGGVQSVRIDVHVHGGLVSDRDVQAAVAAALTGAARAGIPLPFAQVTR